MCLICKGQNISVTNFNTFQSKIIHCGNQYKSKNIKGDILSQFVEDAIKLSKIRFDTGSEWGEPLINPYVITHIFKADDPEEGLLRFLLCCWMDMQEKYQTVWTKYLESISLYRILQMRMVIHKEPLLKKTIGIHKSYSGISNWFIEKILYTYEESKNKGINPFPVLIYFLFHDLWGLDNISKDNHSSLDKMRNGEIGYKLVGNYKRAWMALMWLRLDNSLVKCLFSRSLLKHKNGKNALDLWYNNNVFNPMYCEIPVDGRVKNSWNYLFKTNRKERNVALEIHDLAQNYNISPAVFDAILFGF